jgi:ankyrin repeat protein
MFDFMIEAVRKNDYEEAERWLTENGNIINMRDKTNWTAIDWAANEGFLETMRVLIKFKGLNQYLIASSASEEVQ